MGRLFTVEEVANAVVWLCSKGASYINGHVLPIEEAGSPAEHMRLFVSGRAWVTIPGRGRHADCRGSRPDSSSSGKNRLTRSPTGCKTK